MDLDSERIKAYVSFAAAQDIRLQQHTLDGVPAYQLVEGYLRDEPILLTTTDLNEVDSYLHVAAKAFMRGQRSARRISEETIRQLGPIRTKPDVARAERIAEELKEGARE